MAKIIDLKDAIAIGNDGMVVGGIFAVLGLAVSCAKGGTPLTFLFAGIIVLSTAYSYAKLSKKYPENEGTVKFVHHQYGSGVFKGLDFGIDINTIKKVLFNVGDVWAGFDGIFLNEKLAGIFNTPQVSGVLVQRVTPNSFADRIGIHPGIVQGEILGRKLWLEGDIILSIQGTNCNAPHDLGDIKKLMATLKEGDQIHIEVLRKGETIKLTGKL